LVFPLAEPTTDAAAWKRAAKGACARAEVTLSQIPGIRIEIDRGASCDSARYFWAPNAVVGGAARKGQIFLLRDRVWTVEDLASCAPAGSAELKRAEPVADEILPNDRHETLKRLAASLRSK